MRIRHDGRGEGRERERGVQSRRRRDAPSRCAAAATSPAAALRPPPPRRRSRPWPAASGRSSSGPIARPRAPAFLAPESATNPGEPAQPRPPPPPPARQTKPTRAPPESRRQGGGRQPSRGGAQIPPRRAANHHHPPTGGLEPIRPDAAAPPAIRRESEEG